MRSVVVRRRRSPRERLRRRSRADARRAQGRRHFEERWFELVLDLLRSYVSRTGTSLVPAKHREGGFALGYMVSYLRTRHHAGELSRARAIELERLPGWSWDPIHDRFERALRLLKDFVRRERRAEVPVNHRERGFALGLWVENKRALFRRGRLPQRQVRALETVPGWSWHGKARDRRFHEVLSSLHAFARRRGHIRVPNGYNVLGIGLDRWIVRQREAYRQGRLRRARARALEAVPGWTWRPGDDRFEEGMRRLRRYAEREGHSRVPRRYEEPDFKLGVFVMDQRQRHRLGRLSAERVRRLERLPGWSWNTRGGQGGRSGRPNPRGVHQRKK